MSVSVEKLENSMAKLTIEVSKEDFDKYIEKAYLKQRSKINIPGFRKGKASRAVIEKMYGPSIFFEEAANDAINASYPAAVEECGEDVVSDPKIDVTQIEEGKSFIYTAEVALKPAVSLGKYKGVEVEKRTAKVTAADVDAALQAEREKNSKMVDITDRAVKDGDMITLDFEGFVDGTAFEGGKGTDYPLTIGSNAFIPGFEEQLVGAELNVEKDVNVTFPEEYHSEELKGRPAVFKCMVKAIKEKILPELDDAYADDHSEFSTLKEYKEDLKKQLLAKKEEEIRNARENEAVDKAVADAAVEIPEAMLATRQKEMLNEFSQRMQMQGLSMEQYMQYTGQTVEQMLETMKPEAEKNIRARLVLEQIAKEENITATEEEYEAQLQKLADAYKTDLETVKKLFNNDEKEKNRMMMDLAIEKTVSFLAENAKEKAARKSSKKADAAEEQETAEEEK